MPGTLRPSKKAQLIFERVMGKRPHPKKKVTKSETIMMGQYLSNGK